MSNNVAVSNKPWFLTEVNGVVLIWKNDCRLKVAGVSAGCVTNVSISDGVILVSHYRLKVSCPLGIFVGVKMACKPVFYFW